jgi:hypothetical protein
MAIRPYKYVSTEFPRQIFFCPLVIGHGEQLFRGAELDQVAQIEKCRKIGNARGLGDIVRDKQYGYIVFQLADKLLDMGGGLGIKGLGRLVHQKNIGVHGKGPGDAQALLLAAGEK